MTGRVYNSRYRLHKTVHQLPCIHQGASASGAGPVELIVGGHSIPPSALPVRLGCVCPRHPLFLSVAGFRSHGPPECDAFDDRNSPLFETLDEVGAPPNPPQAPQPPASRCPSVPCLRRRRRHWAAHARPPPQTDTLSLVPRARRALAPPRSSRKTHVSLGSGDPNEGHHKESPLKKDGDGSKIPAGSAASRSQVRL